MKKREERERERGWKEGGENEGNRKGVWRRREFGLDNSVEGRNFFFFLFFSLFSIFDKTFLFPFFLIRTKNINGN